jgi:hypothetical protein
MKTFYQIADKLDGRQAGWQTSWMIQQTSWMIQQTSWMADMELHSRSWFSRISIYIVIMLAYDDLDQVEKTRKRAVNA